MKHIFKKTLVVGFLALTSQTYAATTATQPNNVPSMTPQERAKIEQVVHDYIVNKPEVLVEAMQVLQQRQMDQAQQTVKQTQQIASTFSDALFRQSGDPVAGNPNGKITVVEFFDYQCPHCVDMAPVMDAIIKANPEVRVVYKEFPIRGPMSMKAASAALAAHKQGKYYPFSHSLLTTKQPLTEDVILQIAKDNGLDVDKLKKDMNDSSVDGQLKKNIKLAQDLKLFGTPAFFIGKTDMKNGNIIYIPGQANQQQLQSMIDQSSR